MVKGKRLGMLYVALLLSVMSAVFTSCGKKEESYVVQQDYTDADQESEFDILIADAYMNALVAKQDESYGYRNDYELVSMTQDGNTVILYYGWYRASDQYSENCLEVQLIYQGINGVWGEPKKTFGEVKTIWKLEGEWVYKNGDTDIYFKVNRCEGNTLYVEYSFTNVKLYDNEVTDYFIKNLNSDGEVEMICNYDGTGGYRWEQSGVQSEFSLKLTVYEELLINSFITDYPLTKVE